MGPGLESSASSCNTLCQSDARSSNQPGRKGNSSWLMAAAPGCPGSSTVFFCLFRKGLEDDKGLYKGDNRHTGASIDMFNTFKPF